MNKLRLAAVLAKACAATYEERPALSDYAAPLRNRQVIDPADPYAPLRVLLGHLDETLVIAFRGTVVAAYGSPQRAWVEMLLGMVANIIPALVAQSPSETANGALARLYGGEVHAGFALSLEALWDQVHAVVERSPATRPIVLTGHSLGGALATLAARRLSPLRCVDWVCTFGSPRAGDRRFAAGYHIPHWRFEYGADVVSQLPPDADTRPAFNDLLSRMRLSDIQLASIDFCHVGSLKYMDRDGTIAEGSEVLRERRSLRNITWDASLFSDHNLENYIAALEHLSLRGRPAGEIDRIDAKAGLSPEGVCVGARYNIIIVGRTGSGKSSLINYFYGKDVAKTGVGRPVTQPGFDCYKIVWKDIPVATYDSAGLEVGRHVEWRQILDAELSRRGIDRPATDWFHTVIYYVGTQVAH